MALFSNSQDIAGGIGPSTIRRTISRKSITKGFMWVRQYSSDPGLTMIGVSPTPPENNAYSNTEGTWLLQYFALVDDATLAFANASNFLQAFSEPNSPLENVYRTQPVVAATAIETSGVNVRFRRSEFPGNGSETEAYDAADADDLSDTSLKAVLEKSIVRRQRASQIVNQLDEIEEVLAYSEQITGIKTPPTPSAAISGTTAPKPAEAAGQKPRLYKDTESETLAQLGGPDKDALRRMEKLILRREASQNLKRIRFGYLISFLQGIPLGAIAGLGVVLALNLPADSELLVRCVAAGTLAVPITLFGIRVIRSWDRAAYWRNVLRT